MQRQVRFYTPNSSLNKDRFSFSFDTVLRNMREKQGFSNHKSYYVGFQKNSIYVYLW